MYPQRPSCWRRNDGIRPRKAATRTSARGMSGSPRGCGGSWETSRSPLLDHLRRANGVEVGPPAVAPVADRPLDHAGPGDAHEVDGDFLVLVEFGVDGDHHAGRPQRGAFA